MFSRTAESAIAAGKSSGTAAWRISLWSGIAFAVGTALAFWFLQSFLANDIQNRGDAWLSGELGVLADVAERTPANQLHDAVVDEVAELASHEAPHELQSTETLNQAVFFIQTTPTGDLKLHTGTGMGLQDAAAIKAIQMRPGSLANVAVPGFTLPFRVAGARMPNGDRIYLALSTRYERKVLRRLRTEFALLWCTIIVLGTSIVFISTRRMLHRVQMITETAESIGRNNLRSRVPALTRNDEISRLSFTLNKMLDRIEGSVQQLHAMSDALAHDLRSPMTSVRGKLELALMSRQPEAREEAIVHCIEEVDRLSSLLSTSLDVSEANADALRLKKETVDVNATLRSMFELFEPSFAHAGLNLLIHSPSSVFVHADPALLQRTLANLLDNELKHLAPGSTVNVTLSQHSMQACLLVEDDGPGFPADLLPRIFERYSKGADSRGHGLGLAFVAAVVRSHEGSVRASNRGGGGVSILLQWPVLQPAALQPA